ncbi:contactin-4-like [Poecilia reticulata]|uniref:contactin-4-like n=1 Tax=Poecilia reticulata TaxID=8081 RepID=UPI0004A433AA|nr:PREDICTED: contactin-4-like [Poecilia reticulata]
MNVVVGLLLTLLRFTPESAAGETHCDGREDGGRCFVALGATVIIQLLSKVSEIPKYEWKNERVVILRGKGYNFSQNTLQNRSLFIPSIGTVRIKNLRRTDSGEYTLNIFDSNGRNMESRALQLIVQAPVSSVHLVTECLSRLEMKVSCLTEGGDSPQYIWTLDRDKLTDSELLSANNENNIIILRHSVSGSLACSVRNHISFGFKEQIISACKEFTAGETHCDATEDRAQCFGALGGTVIIRLMINASEIPKHEWKNKTSIILRGEGHNFFQSVLPNRSFFLSGNHMISLKNLSRSDSGEYTLEIFDSEGQETLQTLQLIVQAPVSSVQLVSECLSQLEMKVSCLCQRGDSPQYSWTLDGHTLTDSELLYQHNETNIIVLRKNISGRLVCSVSNQVSYASEEKTLFVCKDNSLLVHSLMFGATILSCGGIWLYFKLKESKYKDFVTYTRKENPDDFNVIEQSDLTKHKHK